MICSVNEYQEIEESAQAVKAKRYPKTRVSRQPSAQELNPKNHGMAKVLVRNREDEVAQELDARSLLLILVN